MSELKNYKVYTTRHEGAWGYHYEPNPNKDQSDIELNDEQVYLKKDADKVIEKLKRDVVKLKSSLKYLVVRGLIDGPVKKAVEDLLTEVEDAH